MDRRSCLRTECPTWSVYNTVFLYDNAKITWRLSFLNTLFCTFKMRVTSSRLARFLSAFVLWALVGGSRYLQLLWVLGHSCWCWPRDHITSYETHNSFCVAVANCDTRLSIYKRILCVYSRQSWLLYVDEVWRFSIFIHRYLQKVGQFRWKHRASNDEVRRRGLKMFHACLLLNYLSVFFLYILELLEGVMRLARCCLA